MRLINADELKFTEVAEVNGVLTHILTAEDINNAPTVEPDMGFAKWVTKMIFDNEVGDFDFELFSELACRKLEKIGLVKKTESEWVKTNEID